MKLTWNADAAPGVHRRREQGRRRNANGIRKILQHQDGGIADPALDPTDVSPVKPGAVSQLFLGDTGLSPVETEIPANQLAHVAGGIWQARSQVRKPITSTENHYGNKGHRQTEAAESGGIHLAARAAARAVAQYPCVVQRTLKRPSHVLVELMRLERNTSKRDHAADVPAFSAYLRARAERSVEKQQDSRSASSSSSSEQIIGRVEIPRSPLACQADEATQEAPCLRSFITCIQRLIDSAVQSWLQEHT